MIQKGIHRRLSITVTESLKKRFWPRVDKRSENDCWNWTGAMRNGYGAIKHKGRVLQSHRVSYVLANGLPPETKLIRHKCDNKACCNPAHLELGTPQQNIHDMKRIHVFRPRGEQIESSVLTNELVLRIWEIRQATGKGRRAIAQELGTSPSTVGDVLRGKSWVHLMPPWAAEQIKGNRNTFHQKRRTQIEGIDMNIPTKVVDGKFVTKREKFPWEDWCDGKWREVQESDLPCKSKSFLTQLRNYAHRNNKSANASVNGNKVRFRIFEKEND